MMDIWTSLLAGFAGALTPVNLAWGFTGCLLGTMIGVLPGIGPALTVAMLMPLTAKVEPTGALIMFAGVYYGAMFGGSTTSILLNTPGESSSMVTAMEGNLMAKNGRAGPALATAAIGSFVAGTIATVLVTLFAPTIAGFALRFGPAEYFSIIVLAFVTVSSLLGASLLRGMASLGLGLTIGLVGMDTVSGFARYTLGVPELIDGIEVVLVAVGLFAVAEALYNVLYEGRAESKMHKMSSLHMTRDDWRRSLPAWLRGSLIGFPFGSIPAGGDSDLPVVRRRAQAQQTSGRVRSSEGQGSYRRRRGPGGGKQRFLDRSAGAAADPGHSYVGNRRHPAGRVPELQPPTGPPSVHDIR
jgi:putative tricarboxylic transport membrane protein